MQVVLSRMAPGDLLHDPSIANGADPQVPPHKTSARAAPQISYTVSSCVLFSITLSPTATPLLYHADSLYDSLCHPPPLPSSHSLPLPSSLLPSHPRQLSPIMLVLCMILSVTHCQSLSPTPPYTHDHFPSVTVSPATTFPLFVTHCCFSVEIHFALRRSLA